MTRGSPPGCDVVGDEVVGMDARAAGLPAPPEQHPAADLARDIVERRAHDRQVPLAGRDREPERAVLPGGHARGESIDEVSRRLHREAPDAGPGHRPAGPLFGHPAADRHAPLQREVDLLPDRPLGPGQFDVARQIRLAVGGEDLEHELIARVGVDAEPALAVGAGQDRPSEVPANLGRHRDRGVGDGLAGVGGQHAAFEDRGRADGQCDLLRGVAFLGPELEFLRGETGVADDQGDPEPAADAGECEPAPGVGGDGLRPGSHADGGGGPVADQDRLRAVEVRPGGPIGRRHRRCRARAGPPRRAGRSRRPACPG